MKQAMYLGAGVVVAIMFYSFFQTEDLISTKEKRDNCLNIEQFIVENPEASPEEYERLEKCNQERISRLGLDKRSTGFLGNTRDHPDGALAHYEGSGGFDYFTVYDDHIEMKITIGPPSGVVQIDYSEIEKLEMAWDMPGTIVITLKSDSLMKKQYSLTLFGGLEMSRPEGVRDLDRLYEIIEKKTKENDSAE